MSYDIYIVDKKSKEVLHADKPHYIAGGTYAVGGTTELWMNMTYNYATVLKKVIPSKEVPLSSGDSINLVGIYVIHGMSVKDSIPLLEEAIRKLGDDESDDYWEASEGNVKKALMGLLELASMGPDGVWLID